MDLWHLKRRFRADDANKSDTDYLIKFDFGAAQTLEAIFINDVNFDRVRIYGHDSDLGNDWSNASYSGAGAGTSLTSQSLDNADLSGDPIIARFSDGEQYIYSKFYPTISTIEGITDDPELEDLYVLEDATLSGTPVTVEIRSGGSSYYLQTYPNISDVTIITGQRTPTLTGYTDCILSGTPRVMKIKVNGTPYYAKIYPNILRDINIARDSIVNRYKLFYKLNEFNYRYLAIGVPTSASAVGSYTAKWEIGTIVFVESITELSENMSYGYEKYADMAVQEIILDNGLVEAMALNDNLKWHGRLIFDNRSRDNESDLHTINALSRHKPLVFFENMGSTQHAYLCIRRDAVRVSRMAYNVVRGSDINLVELV